MSMSTQSNLDNWLKSARKRVEAARLTPSVEQIGRVERVADGIALVSGLPGVRVPPAARQAVQRA